MFRQFWARITGPDQGSQHPQQQAQSMTRAGNFIVIFPTGFFSNLDDNAIIRALDDGVAISHTVERPDDVEPGEVCVFHPKTKNRLVFKDDGSFEVFAEAVKVDSAEVSLTGSLTVDGDVTVNGSAEVKTDLAVEGLTEVAAITSNNIDISNAHKHGGITPGGGTSGPVSP